SPAFASSSVDPNSFPIKPSSFSRKSAITNPLGFSSLISFVLFHPISKFGGSGEASPVRGFRSRIISDRRRFSIGNDSAGIVVSEVGVGSGKMGVSGVELGFEFEFVVVHLIGEWCLVGGRWRRK
ncbi:hypothetical protein PanWU01x14_145910, partial [Parasponia andersonii]